MTDLIAPVILSGGAGTRLWPLSTDARPKQFLPLTGPDSLFRATLDRVADRSRFAAPIVVGSARHADLCGAALAAAGPDARLICEPVGRNTAPAIALAAAVAAERDGADALILVMPSDHVIADVPALHAAIAAGLTAARAGWLVTFGIAPDGPHSGYGYLEMGAELPDAPGVRKVARFVEKPPRDAAERMVAGGQHLWNAGIFLMRADVLLAELAAHRPDIADAMAEAGAGATVDGIIIHPDPAAFAASPADSIDYAVMERSARVATVPMAPGWSDVGDWDALAALSGDDAAIGPVVALDSPGSYVRSDGLKIAMLGVPDMIVVATGDRLLIIPRHRAQEVRRLLEAVNAAEAD